MGTHSGVVRSFDLGGTGTAGRRWSARCKCGTLATTSAWAEALAFLTQHLQVTAKPREARPATSLTPDLRYVEYQPPLVTARNGNGHRPLSSVGARPLTRIFGALVHIVLSALRFSPSNSQLFRM